MIGREVLVLMRVEAQRTLEACRELTGINHPKLALGMAARLAVEYILEQKLLTP